jgi:hypothetical protein
MRFKKLLQLIVAIILLIPALAQDKKSCTISGVVKDARSKLPLNEAVVTFISDAFKGQKFALTDSTGMYRVSNLPAGNYTVSFEMEGYEKFVHDKITLQDRMSFDVSFEMVKERKRSRKRE